MTRIHTRCRTLTGLPMFPPFSGLPRMVKLKFPAWDGCVKKSKRSIIESQNLGGMAPNQCFGQASRLTIFAPVEAPKTDRGRGKANIELRELPTDRLRVYLPTSTLQPRPRKLDRSHPSFTIFISRYLLSQEPGRMRKTLVWLLLVFLISFVASAAAPKRKRAVER